MSDYLSILSLLLYLSGWYLSVSYQLTKRQWRKKHFLDFTGMGKHFIISGVVFLIILVLTLSELTNHYKKYNFMNNSSKNKKEMVNNDSEEEEDI